MYMRMSSSRVFVLVEGRDTDPFFYGELCRPVCNAQALAYEIVRADRVSAGGGKNNLVNLYEYLLSAESLVMQVRGSTSWCIFFFDKDIDDILRDLINSAHIVYTPYYCVENALFLHGDVVRAAASSSALDAARIQARLQESGAWRRDTAERWKEFVALCIISQKYKAPSSCHYGRDMSPLNVPPESATNAAELTASKALLQHRLAMTAEQFDRKFRAAIRLVERIYRINAHDLVFSGKWYYEILMRQIHLAADGQGYNRHALKNGLAASLCATMDFNAEWTEHFRAPLRNLIANEAAE